MTKKIILILAILPSWSFANEVYMPVRYLFGFHKKYASFESGSCAMGVSEQQNQLIVTFSGDSGYGKPCQIIGEVYGVFANCQKGSANMTDIRLQCERRVDGKKEYLRLFNDPSGLQFSLISQGKVRHTYFKQVR